MRPLFLLLFSAIMLGHSSVHAAYKVGSTDYFEHSPTAVQRITRAAGEIGFSVSARGAREERRINKLVNRLRRALPEGEIEKIDTHSLLAIIFGVTALASLFFFPFLILLSIPALVLGIVGLGRVKRDGTRGRGLAIGGIIAGGLGILVMLAGLVMAILILALLL